jgi:hypothetical protein
VDIVRGGSTPPVGTKLKALCRKGLMGASLLSQDEVKGKRGKKKYPEIGLFFPNLGSRPLSTIGRSFP